ncbi:hypothetical protein [Nostoc sp.]|uniref:hypothetical protein n=1 Tax=Nostoc sp. TaxID=1180 RepID=UPI002FF56F2E
MIASQYNSCRNLKLLRFLQEFIGVVARVDIKGDRLLFNKHRARTLLSLYQQVLQAESAGERTHPLQLILLK